jgi:hypothetical protein
LEHQQIEMFEQNNVEFHKVVVLLSPQLSGNLMVPPGHVIVLVEIILS